ncbi:MAG: hypothetical protein JW395_1651 [Nitrospira sp.]|nr:hypothetical protein [Nitrospira sp.]
MTNPPTFTGTIMTFSSPREGAEDSYNQWYQNVHLPQVCDIPGVVAAQRFRLADEDANTSDGPLYLAVYELDADPQGVLAEMGARARNGTLELSDSIDQSTISVRVWHSHGARVVG